MIKGIVIHDLIKNETLSRTIPGIDAHRAAEIFENEPKKTRGYFFNEYRYVYVTINNFMVACITNYPEHCVRDVLSRFTGDFMTDLYKIDEMMNEFGFITHPATAIDSMINMESMDAKIFEEAHPIAQFSVHQKEEEKAKIGKEAVGEREENNYFKQNKYDSASEPGVNPQRILERVRQLEIEVRNEPAKTQTRNPKNILREKTAAKMDDADICVLSKQHFRIEIDREGGVTKGDIDGDLSLKIAKEEFKNITLTYESTAEVKMSPNLDKNLTNTIRSNKEWPVGRLVALLKWKTKVETLPFSFTFWPSEIGDDRYSVLLEICAEVDFTNLVFCIPVEKIKDVVIDTGSAFVDGFLQWNVGTLNNCDSETLEFSCTCDDINELFPITVIFSYNGESPIKLETVRNGDELVDFSYLSFCEAVDVKIK